MTKSTKWMLPHRSASHSSMLLSACGGSENPKPPARRGADRQTAPAAGAPTNTTAAAAGYRHDGGGCTNRHYCNCRWATTATTTTGGTSSGSKFDPSTYKKNAVESGATLRVSSWGDTSEQGVNSDALARFNQVYPDVKITYEPQPSDYQTKLLAQVNGGSEPDVFYVDPGLAYQLIPENGCST